MAELGRGSVRRLTYPLTGILLLLAGRGIAHLAGYPTKLFAVALALLTAMALFLRHTATQTDAEAPIVLAVRFAVDDGLPTSGATTVPSEEPLGV